MIPHAVLCLVEDDNGKYIAVPVTNFPTVPTGSEVYLGITSDIYFESMVIGTYVVDSRVGVLIYVDSVDADDFAALQKLCVEDKTGCCDYVYPEVIDFGGKYPIA